SYADHKYPAIATDGADMIHVVSRESGSGNESIEYRKSDGIIWALDTTLVYKPEIGATSLCADIDGKLHLAFHDRRFGNFEVFYKHFDGADWLPAVRLSDAPGKSLQPSVVSDGAGEVTVVWSDERHGDYTYEIYSRRFDGASWGPEGRLTYVPGTSSIYPSGALDIADAFHVIWSDDRDGNFEIYHKIRGEDASAGIGEEPSSRAQAGPLQVLPNPFMGSVEIRPARPTEGHAVISIYDVSGRLVWERRVTPDADTRLGIVWDGLGPDGKRVAPGVYLVRLKSSKQTFFTKIVMIK
ncbi:T9SS type A sorting domain-containing protein, partial [Candidatus Eisenbacteria bacterium]